MMRTTKNIRRLFIANRGEIALRIIRSAQEMGIHTILAVSSADKNSLPAKVADEAIEIGPAQVAKSYLNVEAILQACRETKADAVHPGYGFLAENADFADAVVAAGMIFVGPTGDTIRLMGDKAKARETAHAANVPVVPGSAGVIRDVTVAEQAAQEIGFPLMIKAAAGGGGKGIRIVAHPEDFATAFKDAQREGLGAFADDGMYLERLITQARHIEVQILGDGEQVVHLYDRECSLQRRRQKLIEEAPSHALTDATREKLCASAVALAKHVNYCGAGTIEYLYDDKTDAFFFIEMNTRIQVEHPVTEMITGTDLIRAMLLIADGQGLPYQQADIRMQGHAIECRINAENPAQDFMPNIGTIEHLHWPGGNGIRIDSMLEQGYSIPPFYDSMLAKIIVRDETREQAIARMRRALQEARIDGLTTTLHLHYDLLNDDGVRNNHIHTEYLSAWLPGWQAQHSQDKE